MAVLRLDESLQVFGAEGNAQIGPVVYGDRWLIDNLVLDCTTETPTMPNIEIYRGYINPRNLIMRSDTTDTLNKNYNVHIDLQSGEPLVMAVTNAGAEDLTTVHIMGTRLLATASYPSQWTHYGV